MTQKSLQPEIPQRKQIEQKLPIKASTCCPGNQDCCTVSSNLKFFARLPFCFACVVSYASCIPFIIPFEIAMQCCGGNKAQYQKQFFSGKTVLKRSATPAFCLTKAIARLIYYCWKDQIILCYSKLHPNYCCYEDFIYHIPIQTVDCCFFMRNYNPTEVCQKCGKHPFDGVCIKY